MNEFDASSISHEVGHLADMPVVSVIVPVYNCESYVGQCLESLKRQTFEQFEALVIDDASTDTSLDVVHGCASDDARFTVFARPENKGLSAVRNFGIERARGDYIVFLDSDDYLREDALELLVARAKAQKLDNLYFNALSFYDDANLVDSLEEDYGKRPSFDDVATGTQLYTYFVEREQFFTEAALQMLSREFLLQNNIRFREGLLHEDILFTFQVLVLAKRCSFLNEQVYLRRLRRDSIVAKRWTWRNVHGHFVGMQEMKRWLYEHQNEVDARFARAVGTTIARWRVLCAEKWESDIDDVEREAYPLALPEVDRVDFYVDVLGSGAASAKLLEEFQGSATYRVGDAIARVPRAIRLGIAALRKRRAANNIARQLKASEPAANGQAE